MKSYVKPIVKEIKIEHNDVILKGSNNHDNGNHNGWENGHGNPHGVDDNFEF